MSARKQKLATITIVYWVLLLYIIAALFWWFVSLENQNRQMELLRLSEIKQSENYPAEAAEIMNARKRKTVQYVGEGATFLLFILAGAVFVFRATRKQIKLAQQQQNFMMAVTHELKTPISIAKLNLETLLKRKLDEATQHKLISNSIDETDRLDALCNNILYAAQFDLGYKGNKQQVNVSDLVQKTAESFSNRINRNIQTYIQRNVFISADETLLQMLLNNLTENAIKYSKQNITLNLAQQNNKTIMQVSDAGPGIPDEEKPKVFDKFYRIGNELSRTTKGTGLGLYLCKKIVEDHNADITITDNKPSGSIFTITFISK